MGWPVLVSNVFDALRFQREFFLPGEQVRSPEVSLSRALASNRRFFGVSYGVKTQTVVLERIRHGERWKESNRAARSCRSRD